MESTKKIINQRMCVGCRTVKNKNEMLRIVKGKNENPQLDISGKKAGKGAYLCKNIECLKIARSKRQFDRAFKIRVDNAIYDELQRHLTETGEESDKHN